MGNRNIDIFIISEAKGWIPHYTKELTTKNIGVIENVYEESRRGGLVILYRLGIVTIKECYKAPATFSALQVEFKSGKHS